MTAPRKQGGQPGPRGPYKPRSKTALVRRSIYVPADHAQVIDRRGQDWVRRVMAEAVQVIMD